jgi:hypothetical protein
MSATLTIRDETPSENQMQEWSLDLLTECITAHELIRRRIYQEVRDYNLRRPALFQGLVQPLDAEPVSNGFRLGDRRQIDWNQQFESAVEAFARNDLVLLVNDKQIASLDQEFEIKPDTRVTFLKLALLTGG